MTAPHRGQIVTFYSYKGGTGRSMALANAAWILAANGARVLAIDWDLEAPGLHRYFRPFLTDPDLHETKGLIDIFWDATADQVSYDVAAKVPELVGGTALSAGANGRSEPDPRPGQFVSRFMSVRRRLHGRQIPGFAARGVASKDWNNDLFPGEGCIDFIGPGRQGPTYSERVNTFDWRGFYRLGGAALLEALTDNMREQYDWILIDSRTGVSDTSGICTMQIPDIVVACLTLNRQSIAGVASVMESIRAWRADRPKMAPIVFLPTITRIENAEKDRLEAARLFARDCLKEFVPGDPIERTDYWNRAEIAYRPWYAYEEVLAPFGDQTGAGRSNDSMVAQMETLVRTIVDPEGENLKRSDYRAPEVPRDIRAEVLRLYAFDGRDVASPPPSESLEEPRLAFIRFKQFMWYSGGKNYRYLLDKTEMGISGLKKIAPSDASMTDYIENSNKMTALSEVANVTNLVALLFNVPFALISFAVQYSPGLSLNHIEYWMSLIAKYLSEISALRLVLLSMAGMASTWLIAAICFGIWLKIGRQAPDGMSQFQVIIYWIRGPFRPRILTFDRDYEALWNLRDKKIIKIHY